MTAAMTDIASGYSLFEADLAHVGHTVGADWDTLRRAEVFITGGTGFFGIWLVESLLWANERYGLGLRVSVLTRDAARFRAGRARHLAGRSDLVVVEGTMTAIPRDGGPYSHIIHAASETNVEQSADWAARHVAGALGGMTSVLDLARQHRAKAVLLTSSGAVYGQADSIVDLRSVEGPGSIAEMTSEKMVYGQAKRMMEIMAAIGAQQIGCRALIARCFAFVGPYLPLDSNYAIGNFMRDVLARRDIVINGDGTPLRSYLYAADLIAWLLAILARGQSGRPYNVGGDVAVSIADLARAVNRVAGNPVGVVIRQSPRPGAQPNAYLPDLRRVTTELGVKVGVSLDDAIGRTLAWQSARC